MNKTIKIIILALIIFCVLFIVSIPIVNDINAKRVEWVLKNITCPEKTDVVESYSAAGKFSGNGNGMQYFACILIKSELNIDELRTHYAEHTGNGQECFVSEQNSNIIQQIEHKKTVFETNVTDGNYYIVYSYGDPIDIYSELDLRGH